MKRTTMGMAALVAFAFFSGCADDPPIVRVANQRGTEANVQFMEANGSTVDQDNVASASYSMFQDLPEGTIVVTAVIQGESVSPTVSFHASSNSSHTVVILSGDPPVLVVDSRSK